MKNCSCGSCCFTATILENVFDKNKKIIKERSQKTTEPNRTNDLFSNFAKPKTLTDI